MHEHSSEHHDSDHASHAGHSDHDDSHGSGGHAEHWGDYNSLPPAPSQLPPIGPLWLASLGFSLAMLLCMIVTASFALVDNHVKAPHHASPQAHGE